VLATLGDRPAAPVVLPEPAAVAVPPLAEGEIAITVETVDDGARVTAIGQDRVGLLSDLAAVFALQRAPVRAARAWAEGEYAVSVWDVTDVPVDPAVLRERFDAVTAGRLDPAARLSRTAVASLAPSVVVRPEASREATVLEVRATDRPGVLYLTLAALAGLDIAVRSAHVDTLGPQAVDVFYLQESSAGALSETRAAAAAHAVRSALTHPGPSSRGRAAQREWGGTERLG